MEFLKGIKPREYQQKIFETCVNKNCLVILPTGLGKTLIALMLCIERMKTFPGKKVLFLAPTKPLVEQHLNYFTKHLPELFADMQLFTGKINSQKRKKIWQTADIIFSTPQCIANDLKKNLYNLSEVCLLIEDEAHRCTKNYDYTYIAKKYLQQSEFIRILGMTASPGSNKEKIKEICRNLSIEEVELRTRESNDVKEYLQKLKFEKVTVTFPPEFEEMRQVLLKLFHSYVDELKYRKVLWTAPSKINLINLQKKMFGTLSRGNKNFNYLLGLSACAQAIKIQHALELLETQTLAGLNNYLKNLFDQASKKKSKGVVKLVSKPEFNFVFMQTNECLAKKTEHPKVEKIIEIISQEKLKNKNLKIILFTQFRDTATVISKRLNELDGINSKVFVGQAKKSGTGLSQKDQKKIINEFSNGEINVLCATCIAEEGLDIPEVNAVIFYEPVPSAIRKIQRCLPAESKILMENGNYKELSQIREKEKVISYNKKTDKIEPKEVLKIFRNGQKKIIEIITEKNNHIKLTKNHPLLTQSGWINAGNLKKSNAIALCKSPNIKIIYKSISNLLPKETYICNDKKLKIIMSKKKLTYKNLQKKLSDLGHKINKKTLWGYINKDAIPINIFKAITKILELNSKNLEQSFLKSRKGNKITFSKISLSELMWLAGIIASDGDLRITSKIRKNRKQPYFTYRFRVCNLNKEILNKAEEIIKKMNLRIGKQREDTIASNNTIIGKLLNNLGIPVTKKSKTIELSDILFQSSQEAIESFLAGVFDGDGNYNKGPCHIRIGTASKKFAFQLQSLFLRIGINSKICQFDKTETRNIKGKIANFKGDFFSVEIYKKSDVAKFLEIKEIVKIKKPEIHFKYSKNKNIKKNLFWVKIKEINELPSQETFNLEVKDNNTFIANNIITHNSGRTARLMKGKLIMLITKKTRDETFYYVANAKEKRMHSAIKNVKDEIANGIKFDVQKKLT